MLASVLACLFLDPISVLPSSESMHEPVQDLRLRQLVVTIQWLLEVACISILLWLGFYSSACTSRCTRSGLHYLDQCTSTLDHLRSISPCSLSDLLFIHRLHYLAQVLRWLKCLEYYHLKHKLHHRHPDKDCSHLNYCDGLLSDRSAIALLPCDS